MTTECSWNDGSEAQYYVVILDWLQGRSGGLERAPEWCVRGPLTAFPNITIARNEVIRLSPVELIDLDARSVMNPTNSSTTGIWHGATRPTPSSIH